jgi:hypothetical protein
MPGGFGRDLADFHEISGLLGRTVQDLPEFAGDGN